MTQGSLINKMVHVGIQIIFFDLQIPYFLFQLMRLLTWTILRYHELLLFARRHVISIANAHRLCITIRPTKGCICHVAGKKLHFVVLSKKANLKDKIYFIYPMISTHYTFITVEGFWHAIHKILISILDCVLLDLRSSLKIYRKSA